MPKGIFIFVYGTLRKGDGNHRFLEGEEFVGNTATEGELFSLGRIPGAHFGPGLGLIQGELYKIGPATLNRLDSLEGYHPERPELSMYVRRKVPLWRDGKADGPEVWAYEYRTPGTKSPRIPHGDWMRYLRDKGEI